MADVGPTKELRASDADREAAAERLRTAALEGRLESDELDERLTGAYGARWCSELAALTADVTPAPPARVGPPVFVRPPPTNEFAIASLACGVLWLGWIGSLLAIVFGHVALAQLRAAQTPVNGRGAAIAGLALGYFGALTFLLMVGFFFLG